MHRRFGSRPEPPNAAILGYSRQIGYAKVSGRWGIAIQSLSGMLGDENTPDVWLFSDAPRAFGLQPWIFCRTADRRASSSGSATPLEFLSARARTWLVTADPRHTLRPDDIFAIGPAKSTKAVVQHLLNVDRAVASMTRGRAVGGPIYDVNHTCYHDEQLKDP